MAPEAGQADGLAPLVGEREVGAGSSSVLGLPLSASVRMGSAFPLTAAVAIGPAPTRTIANAATAAAVRIV